MNADAPDSLAAVLAAHQPRWTHDPSKHDNGKSLVIGITCSRECGWETRDRHAAAALHRAHVADHLAQAVAVDEDEAVRAGRAEALREAARLPASTLGDAWDVIQPSIMPPPPWSYLRRFLHAVADAIEAEQGGGE